MRLTRTLVVALLSAVIAVPVMAASSAASSAVGGSSASVGSVSTSFQASSGSSSNDKVAAGEYRIMDLVAVAERPGFVRLTLRALAADAANAADTEFALIVPATTVAQNGLAAGQVVSAKPRVYGTEFTAAATRQAFFLLIGDDWYRELQANPVVL
jgi:hypothetical protein